MKIVKTQNTTTAEIVKNAVIVLREGGIVIYPTETVYGVGVDATNLQAVQKLLAYKSRREGKPLSIAVTDEAMASAYVELNDQAKNLYAQFMPGPITVISKSRGKVAEGVASEFGTLGTRIPDYPLVLKIVESFGRPVTATSANASGKKRPYSISDILDNLSEKQKGLIDLIIDAGELPRNEPSTVIDTTLSTPVTLRSGTLAKNQLVPEEEADYILTSNSEAETKSIAGRLLLKNWDKIKENSLVIGLEGALGAGKTIFAKGAAEFLGIQDTITSPTYSYIEEYEYERHQTKGRLYHLDVWKIETESDFNHLEVENLLNSNSIIIIEWYSRVLDWMEKLITEKNAALIKVEITEPEEAAESLQRQLSVKQL